MDGFLGQARQHVHCSNTWSSYSIFMCKHNKLFKNKFMKWRRNRQWWWLTDVSLCSAAGIFVIWNARSLTSETLWFHSISSKRCFVGLDGSFKRMYGIIKPWIKPRKVRRKYEKNSQFTKIKGQATTQYDDTSETKPSTWLDRIGQTILMKMRE